MTIKEQIDSFQAFVDRRIAEVGEANLASLDQLWDEWRIENPTPQEYAENLAAINASLKDMERGERGRPAAESTKEMRDKYNLHPGRE